MLSGGREPGNVFIVARRLNNLAKRNRNQCKDNARYRWSDDQDDPRQGDHQCADDDGAEGGYLLGQDIDRQREGNHHQRAGHEQEFGVGARIDVVVNIKRQRNELLPIDDPVAGKDQQEEHEAGIGSDGPEVSSGLRETGSLNFLGAARLTEEQQDAQEHQEHAQRCHTKDILHAHTPVHVRRNVWAGRSADIYQRVIDGVSDRADVFLRGACGGPDDAGLYQRNSQRRESQHKSDQHNQRHRIAHWGEPRRSQRSQQEVGAGQDQISQRKRTAEAHAVGESSAEHRQKPYQPTEESGERAGLLGGKLKDFMQIARQRGERRIIRKALEQLANVSDPERTFEAHANVAPALRKAQNALLNQLSVISCQLPVVIRGLSN